MRRWIIGLAITTASCAAPVEQEEASSQSSITTAPLAAQLAVLGPNETTCVPGKDGWTLAQQRTGALSRFCEYRFAPDMLNESPDRSDVSDPTVEKHDDAEVGMVIGRAQTPEDVQFMEIMAATLYPLFAYHLDIPAAPALVSGEERARLAIVDSMPQDAPAPSSVHAPMLNAIARSMSCAGERCAIEIAHHLALPRVERGVLDYVNGGHYGTLWELAQAIVDAVDSAQAAGVRRLVINLSVGWDGGSTTLRPDHLTLVRGSDLNLSVPERAVHAAIVYARCAGALIFAATGNDDAGRNDRAGPLLPAAWAVHRAPSQNECLTFYGNTSSDEAQELHPLVYPVGGVDHRDQILENARRASTPELVAPSSAVTVPGSEQILTGTSVGTLVASAAAAIVWSIRPELSADQVYALIQSSAVPLETSAVFCLENPCPNMKRISLCRAEAAACDGYEHCEPLRCGALDRPPPSVRPIEMFLGAAVAVLGERPIEILSHEQARNVPGCGEVRLLSGTSASEECPFNSPIAARNLDSSPQPTDPMCPACSVVARPEAVWLMVKLVSQIPGDRIYEPHLVVTNQYEQVMRYALPSIMPEGYSNVFQLPPTGWTVPVTGAWFVYDLMTNGARFAAGGPIVLE